MTTSTVEFRSFGKMSSGRMVTSDQKAGLLVAFARNPYGRHSLVLARIGGECDEAIRHGNETVLAHVRAWMGKQAYRRVRRFLSERKIRPAQLRGY